MRDVQLVRRVDQVGLVEQLERLLGPFTADPDLCLQIGLALQIIRIREVLHDLPDQLPTRSP